MRSLRHNLPLTDHNVAALPHASVPKASWHVANYFGFCLQLTGVLIPVIFLLIMFWQDPFSHVGDFDYDEGINLMKAFLYNQHYTLYQDIWSDQPPLFTVVLAGWLSLFGQSVAAARVLVALFSALLLWSFYFILRNTMTTVAAAGATLLLLLSSFYIRLSGAVMIGLPALALAVLSLAFLLVGKQRRWTLVASGLLMAMALEIKLFVAVLLPAICLYLLFSSVSGAIRWPVRQQFVRVMLWLTVTMLAFLALSFYFHAWDVDMLLSTHFGAQTRSRLAFAEESRKFLADFFREQLIYLLLALSGILYAFWQRNRNIIFPLTWFVTVLVGFAFHRPLWYHHIVLLTIPLIWMGAFGLDGWVRAVNALPCKAQSSQLRRALLLVSSGVAFCALLFYYPVAMPQRLVQQSSLYRPLYIWEIVQQLQTDAQLQPGFVFTDRPFYAFQAGLPVAPPIAAMSRKRLASGSISEVDMLTVLEKYEPSYIVLERFTNDYGAAVMHEIETHYELVLKIEPGYYYRRMPQ